MRILMLSHTSRSGPFRVGSHHYARELAALGHRVVHVSNPVSLAHVVTLRDAEVRSRLRAAVPLRITTVDGAGFAVPWSVLPLTPSPFDRPWTLGSTTLLRRALRRADLLPFDLALVDQPLLGYLLDALPASTVVYRPTDINADAKTQAAERSLVARADGIVATSQPVLDGLLRQRPHVPSAVVENGVEHARFRQGHRPWSERSGVVYVGALDRRFDWDVVAAIAFAQSSVQFDVYGPRPATLPPLPGNVALRGPVPYDLLPATLGGYRVGLLPLNDDVTNSGRSPMKLFEYLAAGLSVVSRWTQPIGRIEGRGVFTYRGSEDAATALRAAYDTQPGPAAEEVAASMDWPQRTRLLLEAAGAMAR